MGFFKNIFKKSNSRYFYIVDPFIFRTFLEKDIEFSRANDLVACSDLYLYLDGQRHHLMIWGHYTDEHELEFFSYYDDEEYQSLAQLFSMKLSSLPSYFKIKLNNSDDVFLNKYREEHPELKIEDYN